MNTSSKAFDSMRKRLCGNVGDGNDMVFFNRSSMFDTMVHTL